MKDKNPEVSVVVPISERHDDMRLLYNLYADELKRIGKNFEFLFIVDGHFPAAYKDLKNLKDEGKPIRIFKYSKPFGESNALMEGFKQAKGDQILTLASYIQIDPSDVETLFSAYEAGNELVITRRYPRKDPLINRIQSIVYHFIVGKLTGTKFKDITSGMRLISKEILTEFNLYGDLHRFIPIIAHGMGIEVKEVNAKQRKEDTQIRLVKPGIYLRRALDLLTLFFLHQIHPKTPAVFRSYRYRHLYSRYPDYSLSGCFKTIGNIGLANRPLLLLGILLVVFGLQLFSVGLIGELILFTRAKEIEHYRIDEIIE